MDVIMLGIFASPGEPTGCEETAAHAHNNLYAYWLFTSTV